MYHCKYIVLVAYTAIRTHKTCFLLKNSPKTDHFDHFFVKISSFFCKNGPFPANTRQTALDDFSSSGNFASKNNQKMNFENLIFWVPSFWVSNNPIILRQTDTAGTPAVQVWDFVQDHKNGNMANESEEIEQRKEPILFCRKANLCGTAIESQC